MAVFKDGNRWRYRVTVALPTGKRVRISGTSTPSTKANAEAAERVAIARLMRGEDPQIGRPLVAGEPRTITVRARVSESEEREWLAKAKRHGCATMSDVIRLAMERL